MSDAREELLRLVRVAEDPSAADEERVLRALQGAIVAGQVTPVSERVEASLGAQGGLPASLAPPGLKLAGVALLLVSAVAVVAPWQLPVAPRQGAPALAPTRPRQPSHVASVAAAPDAAEASSIADAALDAAEPAMKGGAKVVSPSAGRATRAARSRTHSADKLDEPPLQAELALLRRVQAALRHNDGATALATLDAQPSQGPLRAELQAARILALCLLHRSPEARAAAARFALDHPTSPQRAAIDASCANSKRNGAR